MVKANPRVLPKLSAFHVPHLLHGWFRSLQHLLPRPPRRVPENHTAPGPRLKNPKLHFSEMLDILQGRGSFWVISVATQLCETWECANPSKAAALFWKQSQKLIPIHRPSSSSTSPIIYMFFTNHLSIKLNTNPSIPPKFWPKKSPQPLAPPASRGSPPDSEPSEGSGGGGGGPGGGARGKALEADLDGLV